MNTNIHKIHKLVLVAATILTSACVPDSQLPEAVVIDQNRFEPTAYDSVISPAESLEGLWVLTTRNYHTLHSKADPESGELLETEMEGSLRMACSITYESGAYTSTCTGAGNLYLSDSDLSNESRTWIAVPVDNAHLLGSYYQEYQFNRNGVANTLTTSMDFEMTRIGAAGITIGDISITSNGLQQASVINEFYEASLTQTIYRNGAFENTEHQSHFNATGNDGSLYAFYSQLLGISLMANAGELTVDADQAASKTLSNSATAITMQASGSDNNGNDFSCKLSINL
jgi:hypothetical protein